jgi:PBP1b-binding outer membrane lipoprotein LpoB
MIKINGMVRNVASLASGLALAVLLSGCAKQESVAPVSASTDVQAETHAQMVAQADLPEVIVTASRDSSVAQR